MKKLFTASNLAEANHLRYLLERQGVAAELRNIYSSSAFGEIPLDDSLPQIWVTATDLPRAQTILREQQATKGDAAEPWQCPTCHERIDGVFGQCWNCGHEV